MSYLRKKRLFSIENRPIVWYNEGLLFHNLAWHFGQSLEENHEEVSGFSNGDYWATRNE